MAPIHDLIHSNEKKNGTSWDDPSDGSSVSKSLNSESISTLFPEINKSELARLIIQTLSDLGYEKSSKTLKNESGLELDSPIINKFVSHVKNGKFDKAEDIIERLSVVQDSTVVKNKIRLLIKRERFLESLYSNDDTHEALSILRNEINELTTITDIRSLTSLLMNKESEALQKANGWAGSPNQSRELLLTEISDYISPNEMIPKFRLLKLLRQSINYQKSLNLYYFTAENSKVSLYEDIKSEKTLFPDTVLKVLTDHKFEVWYVKFSHDGSKLVTASADHTIFVYDVFNDFNRILTLKGHKKQVMYASFSPDNEKLLSCAIESEAILWDLKTGEISSHISLHSDARIWSGEWYPDGSHFVVSSPDKEIAIYDAQTAEQVYKWDTPIINDIKISANYKLIAATYDNDVEVWDLHTKTKIKTINIGARITSLSISERNPTEFLINVSLDELQLWDWEKGVLITKYVGHKQARYIIRSSFGYDENIVSSGSTDGHVFLWNREFGALLGAFEAHSGITNAVAWNPKIKYMFATCGDDYTVKIWGPSKLKLDSTE